MGTALLSGMVAARVPPTLLLAGIGAVALFLVSFLNPRWGLYLLTFSMLLSPEFTLGETSGSTLGRGVTLRLDDLFIAVVGLSWFAKTAFYKELGLFLRTPLNRPIFFYIAACAISTAAGVLGGRVSPLSGFFYVVKYFEYYVVFFMAVNHMENYDHMRRFLFCLFLTCIIVSIIGILQIPSGGRVSAPFEGPAGEPNTFGGYLLLMCMLAGGIFFSVEGPKRMLAAGAIGLIALVPFFYTQSRSSYLGMIPAFLLLGFLIRKKFLFFAIVAAGLAAAPFLLPSVVKDRLAFTFSQPTEPGQLQVGEFRVDTSTSARLMSWASALRDWPRHPLLGYGVTGYSFIDAQFPRVLVETGVLGFGAFVYLLYAVFRLAFQNLREVRFPLSEGVIIGFIAGYVGLIFHAIGANTFIIVRIMEPFWLIAAMVAVLPKLEGGAARDL